MTTPFKIFRLTRGVTQGEISRKLDIDIALISRIENNAIRDTPKVLEAKARIAEFMGAEPGDIFPEDRDSAKA